MVYNLRLPFTWFAGAAAAAAAAAVVATASFAGVPNEIHSGDLIRSSPLPVLPVAISNAAGRMTIANE